MTRPYHSASSVELGALCERAWAYRYIAKIREPDVPWSAFAEGMPACTHDPRARSPRGGCRLCSRARSAALGTAVHHVGELWYQGQGCDWASLPGLIFLSGTYLLPHPSQCEARTEVCVGTPCADLAWGPKNALEVGGIRWIGRRDLAVDQIDGIEAVRLGARPQLIDYKTSCDIARYAKSPEQLQADIQCSLYALDVMRETGDRTCHARWVYVASKNTRAARAVDVVIERDRAHDIVCEAAELAKHLDLLADVESAVPNTDACSAYGGCTLHESVGGPCCVHRSVAAVLRSHMCAPKKGYDMPLTTEQMEKLRKLNSASTASAPAADAPAVDAPAVDAPVVDAPAKPTPARRGRPRLTPALVVDAPVVDAPAPADITSAIEGLVRARAEARAEEARITGELEALRVILVDALGQGA